MTTADGDIPAELSKLEKSYELLGELSRGEMMTMYLARDKRSGNEVAIKVLRAANARGREALAHYASDARLLTALEHPNIVSVHAVKWLSEDIVAVVTERVRGPTLRQVLDVAGTLPVARATEVLRGMGRGLAWAHSSQIIHRDVRPDNVIFEDGTGRVVLSDFGLARRIEGTARAADPHADAYRAPELSDGRYPDRRSDVYSLGIVGWELLTGRRPWPDTMDPIEPGERAPAPPPLAEVRPGLPPALVAALEGAVQLDRDRRIADVVTFMDHLTKVAPPTPESEEEEAAEEPVSLEPTEWVALPVPRIPHKPAPAAVEREVPREAARETTIANSPVVEPQAEEGIEPTADGQAEREPDRQVERKADRAVEGEIELAAERDVRAIPTESLTPLPVRESQPAAGEHAAAPPQPSAPAATAIPPVIRSGSKQRRPKKGGASRELARAPHADTKPEAAAASPAQEPPMQAPLAAPGLPADRAAAAAGASELGAVIATPPAAQPPTPESGTTKASTEIPSEVELPPPEPVRFADVPSEPLRGPISGLVRDPAHGPARSPTRESTWFEGMRGGLATPRPPKATSRGREASGDVPMPPPLQPMWDTPAEFPLPAMPDPRPMPADAGAGANGVARRRWTRRSIGVAVAVLLLVVAVLTLARMERTPDTTAGLMEPEIPTGYGGDVVLTPRADTAVVGGRERAAGGAAPVAADTLTPGGGRTARGARASGGVAPTPARQPAAPPPSASQPTASPPPAATRARPAGGDPADTRSRRAETRSGTTTAVVARSRTAEEPAARNSPCRSPALADQRACLAAQVEQSDAGLDQVYSEVVAALRRRADTAPGDPDPPEVQRLRAAQRAWLARRDAQCRRRGRGREGRLWATPRAQCFAEFSAIRTRELSATLARLRRD